MENGQDDCWKLDSDDGDFVRDIECYHRIQHGRNASYHELTRAEFVQQVEAARGMLVLNRRVPCEGPVVRLYESVQAIEDHARTEHRRLSDQERTLITGLRHRAHRLFEQQLISAGGYGTPDLDWTRRIPTPPKATTPPPDRQALPDAAIADITRRLIRLGGLLAGGEPETVATAMGWPIAADHGNLYRFDSGLPLSPQLTAPSATLRREGTDLIIEVPLTDRGSDRDPGFARFLDVNHERARGICQGIIGGSPQTTGGRWPELLWQTGDVGVFLRRGASDVALLAMPAPAAAARRQNVITDIEWDE